MVHIKKRKAGLVPAIGIGLLVSLVISLVAAMITAAVIVAEKTEVTSAIYGAFAALLLSSFLGSITASSLAGERPLMMCIINAALYYILLLTMTALHWGGTYRNMLVTALLVLGGATAAWMMKMRKSAKGYRRIKGKHSRA